MGIEIDLNTYRENKTAVDNVRKFSKLIFDAFPDKDLGYLSTLGIIFSLTAAMAHIRAGLVKPDYVSRLTAVLWSFINEVRAEDKKKKGICQ